MDEFSAITILRADIYHLTLIPYEIPGKSLIFGTFRKDMNIVYHTSDLTTLKSFGVLATLPIFCVDEKRVGDLLHKHEG